MVAFGVASTVAIQFYVAIQIMYPTVADHFEFSKLHPVLSEELFRTFWMLIVFVVAEIVPNLGILLSFIGAGCCTAIVFVFPTISELIIKSNSRIGKWIWTKNIIILIIAFIGGIMGMALALIQLFNEYKPKTDVTPPIS
jgi:proton-coupled amino acid transporter